MARCPRGTVVQTVLVERSRFTFLRAKSWVSSHGFVARKVDTTERYYRFRQYDPGYFARGSFRTIELTRGVKAVVGCPTPKVKRAMRSVSAR